MTPLQTATQYLAAVRIGRTEYAYYDDATQDWWVAESHELRDLGRRLQRREPDAYSCWCADTLSRRMTTAERARFARWLRPAAIAP